MSVNAATSPIICTITDIAYYVVNQVTLVLNMELKLCLIERGSGH